MSKASFLLGDFVFNMVKVLSAYGLIKANTMAKCSEKTEWTVNLVVAVLIASLTTWNSARWDLFSNGMLWMNLLIISISVKILYRMRFMEGVSVVYLFWASIHLIDFMIQSMVYYLLAEVGQSELLLMKKDWVRGTYLVAFSIGCVWLGNKLKGNRILFQILRKRKLFQFLGIVLATGLMVYFQRIYIFLVSEQYVALWIVFLLIMIVMGCAVWLYAQKLRWDEQERLQQIKLSMMEENYEQMIRMYKEKSVLIHDEKHHFQTIRELLLQGEYQGATNYVEKIAGELERSGSRVWSGHPMLDLILNIKMEDVKKYRIDIDIKFDDMSGLVVDEIDICALVSNLMDNAVEANLKVECPDERWIKFYGERRGSLWIINSSNPVAEKVVMEDGKLKSSKKDKVAHGYGSESIRRVLNKYNGDVSYQIEESRFAVTLFLGGFK